MPDLGIVVITDRSRRIEQGRQQIALDVANIAAGVLHAPKDVLDVGAVDGAHALLDQLCRVYLPRDVVGGVSGAKHLNHNGHDLVQLLPVKLFHHHIVADVVADDAPHLLHQVEGPLCLCLRPCGLDWIRI